MTEGSIFLWPPVGSVWCTLPDGNDQDLSKLRQGDKAWQKEAGDLLAQTVLPPPLFSLVIFSFICFLCFCRVFIALACRLPKPSLLFAHGTKIKTTAQIAAAVVFGPMFKILCLNNRSFIFLLSLFSFFYLSPWPGVHTGWSAAQGNCWENCINKTRNAIVYKSLSSQSCQADLAIPWLRVKGETAQEAIIVFLWRCDCASEASQIWPQRGRCRALCFGDYEEDDCKRTVMTAESAEVTKEGCGYLCYRDLLHSSEHSVW